MDERVERIHENGFERWVYYNKDGNKMQEILIYPDGKRHKINYYHIIVNGIPKEMISSEIIEYVVDGRVVEKQEIMENTIITSKYAYVGDELHGKTVYTNDKTTNENIIHEEEYEQNVTHVKETRVTVGGRKITETYSIIGDKVFYNPTISIENPNGTREELYRNEKGDIEKRIIYFPDGTQKIINYGLDDNGYIEISGTEMVNSLGNAISEVSFNRIEYDDNAYNYLMKDLINIKSDLKDEIDSGCNEIASIKVRNEFDKEQITSKIGNIVNSRLEEIDSLKENINYSLLAYQSCDNGLKDMIDHSIVDNLFDESETNVENVFKANINSYIEDNNNDGILEYKKDTNIDKLYENVIPAYEYKDDKGNIWYFNKNCNLISADGNDLKIIFGGEEFSVSFTDRGLIKLTDSSGNPLNIFGKYNVESKQFGGNQNDFYQNQNVLLEDENIKTIFDMFDPMSTPEERSAYLDSFSDNGCAKIAMTNLVFKALEGKEDEFYDKFGYPMYNIKMNEDGSIGGVDYNYEPLALELSLVNNVNDPNQHDELLISLMEECGTVAYTSVKMKKYLELRYGITDEDYDKDCIYYADYEFNIYDMDGNMIYSGGDHAMVKIGETEDGKWIVSSWGEELICEYCNPEGIYGEPLVE